MQISRKVNNMPLGLAVAVVLIWAFKTFWHLEVPNEVAMAMTAIIMAGFGYLIREARPE